MWQAGSMNRFGTSLQGCFQLVDIHPSDCQRKKTVYQLLSAALSEREKERTSSTEAGSRWFKNILSIPRKVWCFCSQGCQTATHTSLFRSWQPPMADIHLDLSQRWLCQTCRQVPRVRAMQTNGCQSLTTFRRCFRRFRDDGMMCEHM